MRNSPGWKILQNKELCIRIGSNLIKAKATRTWKEFKTWYTENQEQIGVGLNGGMNCMKAVHGLIPLFRSWGQHNLADKLVDPAEGHTDAELAASAGHMFSQCMQLQRLYDGNPTPADLGAPGGFRDSATPW